MLALMAVQVIKLVCTEFLLTVDIILAIISPEKLWHSWGTNIRAGINNDSVIQEYSNQHSVFMSMFIAEGITYLCNNSKENSPLKLYFFNSNKHSFRKRTSRWITLTYFYHAYQLRTCITYILFRSSSAARQTS